MLEFLLILYILVLFIFPIPGVAIALGAGTSYLLYRKYLLWKNQPDPGKKIVALALITGAANIIISLILGAALAFTVRLLIFKHVYLFFYNFVFCSLISMRWFDFLQPLYRHFIFKYLSPHITAGENDPFAMLIGLRTSTGWGRGLTPVFLDSGILKWQEHQVRFDGVLVNLVFEKESLISVEKISSEKIKILPAPKNRVHQAESYLIVLRDQFYPFRSRKLRDRLLGTLQNLKVIENKGLGSKF